MSTRRFSRKRSYSRRPVARRSTGRYRARFTRGVTRRVGKYGRFNKFALFQGSRKAPELKVFDYPAGALGIGLAGNASFIEGLLVPSVVASNQDGTPGISQGSGINQRTGHKILVRHIQVNCAYCPKSATTALNFANMCRAYLILDTQCNGAAETALQVLAYYASNQVPTAGLDTYQFLNLDNSGRFKILRMKSWSGMFFSNVAGNVTGIPKSWSWNLKCAIPIEYASNATTLGVIGEIKTNNLFVLFQNSVSYTVDFTVSSRVRYSDL